jgi:hypothetical protein
VTFKTFFDDVIKPKFIEGYGIKLCCKMAISKSKILVKKIGTRKYKNEVRAGRVVNNTYKIMSQQKKIKEYQIAQNPENKKTIEDNSLLMLSKKIYDYLINHYEDYAILSCWCSGNKPTWNKVNLWYSFETKAEDEIVDNVIYYTSCKWCETHWDEYLWNILDTTKSLYV